MPFSRNDRAFELCRKHLTYLKETPDAATLPEIAEIENRFVASLTLLVISSYENHIEGLFNKRAAQCKDAHVISFIADSVSKKFRSPDLAKIYDHLKKFSSAYRADFVAKVGDSETAAAWDKVMRARHEIVHGQGVTQLTFEELYDAYKKTTQIIDELQLTLNA